MSDSSWSVSISLHTRVSHPFVSRPFVPSLILDRTSAWPNSLSLFAAFFLFLAAADPEAGERAGRYVHFYALIYAHAYTKNNPVSKLKDNKRLAGDATGILPPRQISFHIPILLMDSSFFRRSHYLLYSTSSANSREGVYFSTCYNRENNN